MNHFIFKLMLLMIFNPCDPFKTSLMSPDAIKVLLIYINNPDHHDQTFVYIMTVLFYLLNKTQTFNLLSTFDYHYLEYVTDLCIIIIFVL